MHYREMGAKMKPDGDYDEPIAQEPSRPVPRSG